MLTERYKWHETGLYQWDVFRETTQNMSSEDIKYVGKVECKVLKEGDEHFDSAAAIVRYHSQEKNDWSELLVSDLTPHRLGNDRRRVFMDLAYGLIQATDGVT